MFESVGQRLLELGQAFLTPNQNWPCSRSMPFPQVLSLSPKRRDPRLPLCSPWEEAVGCNEVVPQSQYSLVWRVFTSLNMNIGLKPVKEIISVFYFKCGNIPLKSILQPATPVFIQPRCFHILSNTSFDYWNWEYLSPVLSLFPLLYLWNAFTRENGNWSLSSLLLVTGFCALPNCHNKCIAGDCFRPND